MKIISGGQTGADQAGWRAAKACGLETGGWMPKGWKTEQGPMPQFRQWFSAMEWPYGSYPERTRMNVDSSDITLWMKFSDSDDSPGYWCTKRACERLYPPRQFLVIDKTYPRWKLAEDLKQYKVVNIAGSRESRCPGIGNWAETYLKEVFFGMKNDNSITAMAWEENKR
jgi:hypothetical protein